MHFLLVFFILINTIVCTAQASPRGECGEVLSPSSPAYAYISLVQLYINQFGSQASGDVVNRIQSSEVFLNPFVGRDETFVRQLAQAIERLRFKIRNWAAVRSGLRTLLEKNQAADQDRAQNETDTSFLFAPEFSDKQKLNHAISSSPAWMAVGEQIFVVVADTYRLYLYELVNSKLKLRDTVEDLLSARFGYSTPSWQVVDGRFYLVVTSKGAHLDLFELIGGKLKFKSNSSLRELTQPAWQMIGDKAFVVAGSERDLMLYELDDGQLKFKDTQGIREEYFEGAPTWHMVNNRAFLAIGTDLGIRLYEVVDGNLVDKGLKSTERAIRSAPAWQTINGRTYMTVGTIGAKLYLYELIDGELKGLDIQQEQGASATPVWQVVDGRVFVAVGSRGQNIRLYELIDGKSLQLQDSQATTGRIEAAATWHVFDGRVLLAVTSYDNGIYFYELKNGKLIFINLLRTSDSLNSSLVWQVLKDGSAFAAVGSSDKHLYLISTIKKLSKQGGQK